MATKERFQNPVIGDNLNLRLFVYNSNNRANFSDIDSVEIYYLDPMEVTDTNPDGRRLIDTILASNVTLVEEGQYLVTTTLDDSLYPIGKYLDIWKVVTEANQNVTEIDHQFEVYPDLWYTGTLPTIYDFLFAFKPNKIRQCSKRWLIIDINPNVPRASDLERYYTNLAIASPLKINIELACSDCMPVEQDLRTIVENESVEIREKCVGYYFLDTTDFDCGIYNVWFEMEFGESKYISDKQQLQIYI